MKCKIYALSSLLPRRGYNHIGEYDSLMDYQQARLETFQSANPTIQNSFAASGLVPLDAERVLNKLNTLHEHLHHHKAGQAADPANSHQKHLELLLSY